MKFNTSPISGTQELLPAEQSVFDRLKTQIANTYKRYGFLNIETPIIERTEILLAKAGGDTEKQIYFLTKTAETSKTAETNKTAETKDLPDQALRFDHTVPLARYVVEHNQSLSFPFHASQINRNYRGERPQRGRFRELYQCDIDVIGRDHLPLAYDAKVIACIHDALQTFNLPPLTIRISNRKILASFLETLNLSEKLPEISSIIDHAEKVSPEKTQHALESLTLSPAQVEQITTFMHIKGAYETVEQNLKNLLNDQFENLKTGLSELKTVFDLLNKKPNISNIEIDFMIIRGLDYYTGTVFETFLNDHRAIGSIASGGRYDNLASNFSSQKFPGVGGSIGLTRLFFVLNDEKLLNTEATFPIDYVLLPLSENEYATALLLADKLRASNHSVDIDFTTKKLGDRFNRAAKISQNAIVIGESEASSHSFEIKNLQTGTTTPLILD
ncbi:histidine--tRNA ligase [Candidatus Saccharibacteria bacterium]|nr:histidine--tRNA ligase [Candidatus Saccharibacteria bacterium]